MIESALDFAAAAFNLLSKSKAGFSRRIVDVETVHRLSRSIRRELRDGSTGAHCAALDVPGEMWRIQLDARSQASFLCCDCVCAMLPDRACAAM